MVKNFELNKDLRIYVRVLLSLYLVCFSCRERSSECLPCATTEKKASFTDRYLRHISGHGNSTSVLVSLDSLSGAVSEFELCQPLSSSIENRKIIKATGAVFQSCETAGAEYLAIQDYEIVDYCTKSPSLIEGSFTLADQWFIHSISEGGVKFNIPCESYPNRPFLYVRNSETIIINGVVNGLTARISENGQTSFSVSNLITGVLAGTSTENSFENLLRKFFEDGSEVKYSISQGKLQMSNQNLVIEAYIN